MSWWRSAGDKPVAQVSDTHKMDSIELVRRADGTVDIDATVDFYDERWADHSTIYRFQSRHRQAVREQLRTMLARADLPPNDQPGTG